VAQHPDRLARDRNPVGHVGDYTGDHDGVVGVSDGGGGCQTGKEQNHHDDEHRSQGRQGPQRPPNVEGTQIDAAVLVAFGQQQRRNQIARQDEEQGHARAAAAIGEARHARVRSQDRQNRDTTQPVELGAVLHGSDSQALRLIDGE
jgi:hypothetical protein